jgi:hypothetical protein
MGGELARPGREVTDVDVEAALRRIDPGDEGAEQEAGAEEHQEPTLRWPGAPDAGELGHRPPKMLGLLSSA